jgi:ABC-type dipeptide/oligopeptide/nickel transport system permease subunit
VIIGSQLRLRERPWMVISVAAALLLAGLAIFGQSMAPHDPIAIDLSSALAPPDKSHWLGADQLGRDVLSRVLAGAQASLLASALITMIAIFCGGLLGYVAGFYGGWLDGLSMRIFDVLMAFPGILLALVAVVVLGPGLWTAVVAVGISEIPPVARLARSVMLSARESAYVDSARLAGASELQVLTAHLIPNCTVPLLIQASLIAADAVLIVAGLGYLGVGAQPPTPEWGYMLSDSQLYLAQAPLLAVVPGIAILLSALIFNLLGDQLRVALNPA